MERAAKLKLLEQIPYFRALPTPELMGLATNLRERHYGLMSLYSAAIVYFDIVPPLQFTGSAAVGGISSAITKLPPTSPRFGKFDRWRPV